VAGLMISSLLIGYFLQRQYKKKNKVTQGSQHKFDLIPKDKALSQK
jgi:hypothetical protein